MPNQFDRMTKTKAHNMVRNAVSLGQLNPEPCLVCHDPDSVAHHPDYNKPTEVMYLCRKHHTKIHRVMSFIPPVDKYVEGSINLKAMLDNIEKCTIVWVLRETNWNQPSAAKYLGVSFRSLRYKIDYHRIIKQEREVGK